MAEEFTAAATKETTNETAAPAENKLLVTKDMIVGDILKMYPDAAYALMNCGMGCISCPAALGESLEEACYVHGLDSDEVAEYVNAELGLID